MSNARFIRYVCRCVLTSIYPPRGIQIFDNRNVERLVVEHTREKKVLRDEIRALRRRLHERGVAGGAAADDGNDEKKKASDVIIAADEGVEECLLLAAHGELERLRVVLANEESERRRLSQAVEALEWSGGWGSDDGDNDVDDDEAQTKTNNSKTKRKGGNEDDDWGKWSDDDDDGQQDTTEEQEKEGVTAGVHDIETAAAKRDMEAEAAWARCVSLEAELEDVRRKYEIAESKIDELEVELEAAVEGRDDAEFEAAISSVKSELIESQRRFLTLEKEGEKGAGELRAKITKLEHDLEAQRTRCVALEALESEMEDAKKESLELDLESARGRCDSLETRLDATTAELATTKAKLSSLESEQRNSEMETTSERNRASSLESRLEAVTAELTTANTKISNLESEQREKNHEQEKSDRSLAMALEAKNAALAAQLSSAATAINDGKQREVQAAADLMNEKERVASLEIALASAETAAARASASETEARREAEMEDAKKESLELDLESARGRCDSLETRLDATTAELATTKAKLSSLESEQRNSEMETTSERNRASSLESRLEAVTAELTTANTKISNLESEQREKNHEQEKSDRSLAMALEAKNAALAAQLSSAATAINDGKQREVQAAADLMNEKERVASLEIALASAETAAARAAASETEARREADAAAAEAAAAREVLRSCGEAESEVEDLQQRCRTLELALEATKASASSMRDDVTEAGDRAAAIAAELESANGKLAKSETEARLAKEELRRLTLDKDATHDAMGRLTTELSESRAAYEKTMRDLEDLRNSVTSREAELLEEIKTSQEAAASLRSALDVAAVNDADDIRTQNDEFAKEIEALKQSKASVDDALRNAEAARDVECARLQAIVADLEEKIHEQQYEHQQKKQVHGMNVRDAPSREDDERGDAHTVITNNGTDNGSSFKTIGDTSSDLEARIKILERQLRDSDATEALQMKSMAVLRDELAELQRVQRRNEVHNLTYLKNVVLKLIETRAYGELLPVIGEILAFSPEEMERAKQDSSNSFIMNLGNLAGITVSSSPVSPATKSKSRRPM